MFNLKADLAKVASVIATVWTDTKLGATDVANFITNNSASIETTSALIGTDITAALPGLKGAVTTVETLESKLFGIVAAGSTEIENATEGNAPQTIAALKALLPQLQTAITSVSTHPAVVAANQ